MLYSWKTSKKHMWYYIVPVAILGGTLYYWIYYEEPRRGDKDIAIMLEQLKRQGEE